MKKGGRFLRQNYYWMFFASLLALWAFIVTPQLLKLQDDFSYSAEITSVDNFYDEQTKDFEGEKYSQTEFNYQTIGKEGSTLLINNTFHVKDLSGKTIFKSEPNLAINSFSQKHDPNFGDKSRNGYLFAPRGVKKDQSFEFWHPSTPNTPNNMVFAGEEVIYGTTVYRFKKSNTQEVDQTSFMGFLPGVPEERGVKLASELELWVEPVSGHLVKMEDYSTDYFYYDIKTGEKIAPYNSFINTYSEESVRDQANNARNLKNQIYLIDTVIPLFFTILLIISVLYRLRIRFVTKSLRFLKQNILVIIVLTVGVALSFIAYRASDFYINGSPEQKLEVEAKEIEHEISGKLEVYKTILIGAKGLFQVDTTISRKEWKEYVKNQEVEEYFPGVQGVGFAKIVPASNKLRFESEIRNEGFPNFKIFPDNPRDIYSSIIYLEPFDARNQKAFGYDMLTEKTRMSAMKIARDSGEPSLSGKVTLVQEDEKDVQPGFLMYVPVYKSGADISTIENKQKNIIGYTYSPFRVRDFIENTLSEHNFSVHYNIYDGLRVKEENLLYSSKDQTAEDSEVVFRKIETAYIAGHPWTYEFIGTKDSSITGFNKVAPYMIFASSLLVTFLLLSTIISLTQSRRRAVKYADKATSDLQKNITELENSKKAMLNILEDIEEEKAKNEYYAEIIRDTADAVISVNLSGAVTAWNPGAQKLFGYSSEEILGNKINNVLPQCYDQLKKVLEDSKNNSKIKTFNHSTSCQRKDGTPIDVSLTISPVKNQSGRIAGISLLARDITKEKEIDRAKTEFVSLAAHQLKTPVGAAKWNIETLLDGSYGKLGKDQREVVEGVYQLNERMGDILNQFLNISRIELGTIVIAPVETDFRKMCEAIIEDLQAKIKERKHIVKTSFPSNMPKFMADPKLLRIIIENLMTNAIKYSPDGSEITTSIKYDSRKINVVVRNTGTYISDTEKSKLFQKLYRGEKAQTMETDGTGIGLYLVKSIVESAGGNISIESKNGAKPVTSFSVVFPRKGMKEVRGRKAES